ncbi:CHAT domain-containing protein [Splendidivirga corallicola]|uniref:CHAT domain-containing protein n=1 Tax=Splendidivirga corallicola TaxID=3051826 RepID=UPI003211BACF
MKANEALNKDALETTASNFYLSIYFEETGEPFKALEIHQKVLDQRRTILGDNHLLVAKSYRAIGDTYLYGLRDFVRAKDFYNKSCDIREKLIDGLDAELMLTYNTLSICYRNLEDYESALFFGRRAIDICEKLPGDNTRRITNFYNNLGNIFNLTKKYNKAIDFYHRAIDLAIERFGKDYFQLVYYYDNLGATHKEYGEKFDHPDSVILRKEHLGKALSYFKKALIINQQYDYSDISPSYYNLGWAYAGLNNFEEAKFYYDLCLEERLKQNYDQISIADVYHDLGQLYQKFDSLNIGLKYYQKAIQTVVEGFDSKTLYENPEIDSSKFHPSLFRFVLSKAKILHSLYKKVKDSNYLKESLNTYLVLDEINDITRNSLIHENSKLFLEAYYDADFEEILDISYQLYEIHRDDQFLETFFKFLEKSKYIVLLESLLKAREFGNLNVPDSIVQNSSDLTVKMAYLYQQRNELMNLNEVDQSKLQELDSQMVEVARLQEQSRDFMFENYPGYYNIKYDSVTFTLDEVQTNFIDENTMILEYFWGSNDVFVLKIKKDFTELIRIPNSEELRVKVQQYLNLFSSEVNIRDLEAFKHFSNLANDIYLALVDPAISGEISNINKKQKLVIVPDGPLSTLSFESLLVKPTTDSMVNYKNLNYLIKDFEVTYAYSTTLQFTSGNQEMRESTTNKVLAFSYSDEETMRSKSDMRDNLEEIPGSIKEIRAISNIVDGEFYFGSSATKKIFKEKARDFNVIHLALHGITDQRNPFNSRLVFRNSSEENDYLYTYELYNLNIGSKLVVLSACESGLGKDYAGEGLYSIARGFAYSGCPSMIMSLWKVNDQRTSELMTYLYENLVTGKSAGTSLKDAKLEYLAKADEFSSHPINWASFVVLGENSPLVIDSKNSISKVLIISFVFGGVLLLMFIGIGRLKKK